MQGYFVYLKPQLKPIRASLFDNETEVERGKSLLLGEFYVIIKNRH